MFIFDMSKINFNYIKDEDNIYIDKRPNIKNKEFRLILENIYGEKIDKNYYIKNINDKLLIYSKYGRKKNNLCVNLVDNKIEIKELLKKTHMTISTEMNNIILNFLKKKCKNIVKLNHIFNQYNEKTLLGNKYIIIKGKLQSGKTSMMICSAIRLMLLGISSIIVVRDSCGDLYQLKSRIDQIREELRDYLKKNNLDPTQFPLITLNKDFNGNIFKESLSINNEYDICSPKIVLIMGNSTQLEKVRFNLNQIEQEGKTPYFSLFIDEVDSIDSGIGTRRGEILNIIKLKSLIIFGVSATILESCIREKINEGDIIFLDPPKNYHDIELFRPCVLNEEALPSNKEIHDSFIQDPNLKNWLINFASSEPYDINTLNFDQKHPLMCLMNIGVANVPQHKLFNYMAINHPNVATILWNGNSIDLYHESLIHKKIKIPVKQYTGRISNILSKKSCLKGLYNNNIITEGAHHFKPDKVYGVSNIIQYLKDNGGVDKYKQILIICGHIAGRGISFTSADYGEYLSQCSNGNSNILGWRITDLYLILSKSTHEPGLLQASGRGCCVTYDGLRCNLHTTLKIKNDICRAINFQEEIIHRGSLLQKESKTNILLSEACNQIKIRKEKYTNRASTPKIIHNIGQKVSGNDNGFGMEKYCYEIEKNMTINQLISSEENKSNESSVEGEMRLITYSKLANISKQYYNRMLEYLNNYSGKWYSKSKIINNISTSISEGTIITNSSWAWHSNSSTKSKYVCNETETGLIFRFKNNIWELRYNV